ncbi:cytochrome P450 [Streptomyces sp. DSM 44915]|uniref:Cytochrome P450 n=1 Tax=Streptomyces chisholmiae TaxID=3075540 RepID=A0ABU2JR57_9ACTN|nr:cytochrome P450 [Streptomyces sp. DSM 44915]MDT0267466.1 cytochrome P450 [Streptomyces sp. DSM 44915]
MSVSADRPGTRSPGRSVTLPRAPGAPFPGVVAHHEGPSRRHGHAPAFHEATVVRGEPASHYFRASGISAHAEENGGLCTFWMGPKLGLYQITNEPLVGDDVLAPSTDANRALFGDFMGSLPHDHPDRPGKRAVVERSLGSARFVERLEPAIRRHTADHLVRAAGRTLPLDDFTLALTAHVDSLVPGVLDLTQRPLPAYLESAEYGRVVRGFFDLASDVISNDNPGAMREFDVIVPFVRDLLTENFDALADAPESNLVRRHFALWGLPFSRRSVADLDGARVKELGTVIVATYDTTALSLLWAIGYLEANPPVKDAVVAEARRGGGTAAGPGCPHAEPPPHSGATPSVIDLAVLEAVRLGGSNPSALWRRTTEPFTLRHRGVRVTVPPGTMMWLDRRQANRDPAVFPEPLRFAPANVRAIVRSDRETLSSLLSRGRYEINSFSMVNADRNPRKCPGRLFSVRMQSVILAELYGRYAVTTRGTDLRLKHHASMPRPARPGTITIRPEPGPPRDAAPPREPHR